jgi:hypothetical protein
MQLKFWRMLVLVGVADLDNDAECLDDRRAVMAKRP